MKLSEFVNAVINSNNVIRIAEIKEKTYVNHTYIGDLIIDIRRPIHQETLEAKVDKIDIAVDPETGFAWTSILIDRGDSIEKAEEKKEDITDESTEVNESPNNSNEENTDE